MSSQLSRVAGVYVASLYARWAGKVTNSPGASGAQTLNLLYGFFRLIDGRTITPFSTSCPITVGTGSNAETVTPSAVSGASANLPQNSCNITATYSNIHGDGDLVSSGTAGLCEACQDAFNQGGGVVVLDNEWLGTAANIATARAAFPSIGIVDNRTGGGSGSQSASITLTSAQLLALQTTAVTLIPAAGASTAIVPLGFTLQYKAGATPYTIGNADNAFQLEYVGKTTNIAKTNATGVVDQAASQVITVAPAVAGTDIAQTNEANLGVEVKLVGTTPALTLGNGTVTLTVRYQVVTLS